MKVYAVTIPDTDESSFKMINWFSTAGTDFGALESAVPNQYDVELFDENWWRVMESFARDLAIHRNNVIFMDAEALLMPESTLLGSDSRKPYVTGTDGKMAAGKYLFDWKNFDRMVDLFQNAGAMQYIYLAGNSKVIRGADDQMQLYVLEDGGNGKLVRVLKPIYTDQAAQTVNPEAEEYLKTMFRALRSHYVRALPAASGQALCLRAGRAACQRAEYGLQLVLQHDPRGSTPKRSAMRPTIVSQHR